MAETIFSRILRGEIPCHKVYEDEHVLAFLDISLLARGHTLVIPKEPAVTLDALCLCLSSAFDIEHSTFQLETEDRRRLEQRSHA